MNSAPASTGPSAKSRAVRTRPPTSWLASKTMTRVPRSARARAAVTPAIPAPTTTTSALTVAISGFCPRPNERSRRCCGSGEPGGWSPPLATLNLSTRHAVGRRGRVVGRIVDADNARDAARRDSWAAAYEELHALDPAQLAPDDLEALADAAWWLSRPDESIVARQRAYAGYVAAGDQPRAAYCAGRLCMEHFFRDEPAVASGWLMRAQRLLRDQPGHVQHGYVALIESNMARARGATEEAVACAERATDIGQRFGDADVVAMAIHQHGLALIDAGRVAEGMALLDEAMASVVAGELGTFFTGVIYGNVIAVGLEVSDVGRL